MRKRTIVFLLAALTLGAPALIWPASDACAGMRYFPENLDPLRARHLADDLMTRCWTWRGPSFRSKSRSTRMNDAFAATEFYRIAANQGDIPSMEALARIYTYGMTEQVKASPVAAAEWRRKAQEARQAAPEGVKGEPPASPDLASP